jgi:carbonic anhydrase
MEREREREGHTRCGVSTSERRRKSFSSSEGCFRKCTENAEATAEKETRERERGEEQEDRDNEEAERNSFKIIGTFSSLSQERSSDR